MLADPQSVTVNSIAISLPATRIESTKTTYSSADGNNRLIVSFDDAKKDKTRYLLRFEEDAIAAHPITGANVKQTLAAYIVIEQPTVGFTDARVLFVLAGMFSWADATLLGKVLGNQH